MADEMVEYSKNKILAQAGQSMLAQANQATQGVLITLRLIYSLNKTIMNKLLLGVAYFRIKRGRDGINREK